MTDELEWARTEARQTFKDCPIARPWAFEFTPASSEPATDAYLRKVGDADFVVWLVGSQTTQPVVNEINTSIATGRRLLVFQLPADDRDALTQQLLCTASKYCKWQTITKQTPLRQALAASIRDEFVRALRDPPPARRRTLEQWRDLSVAKCRQSWITLGVPPDVATELANDRSVGDVLSCRRREPSSSHRGSWRGKVLGGLALFSARDTERPTRWNQALPDLRERKRLKRTAR